MSMGAPCALYHLRQQRKLHRYEQLGVIILLCVLAHPEAQMNTYWPSSEPIKIFEFWKIHICHQILGVVTSQL